ncbi:MAG: bifunctional diaminohydroxyphosphoribosylaminopyrimidine deaminase/5-amino-6-(5-phosphoribosylamino)uracil reductase RibD [Candidatus Diapherotrites archaeon]|uniref:Bifunctional diaminohydroxyphosphoribosylaminopyrimidine deaminase/5-amino-6-(5-phosphoribosylamino)uracil reductase RibD n=1 Tax=Candidatus Iainarchaeum sp. TaxID=3101447 RepID=A0A8T3YMB0_9ARCH|nr:bifunctional diaminohydroxyphosphoribosylaminopyrimidine deaminase/5-amino-6-(5-phosphoribosylamino)uracil reductase RibD [Candidatus Diapherotrites archaeon]
MGRKSLASARGKATGKNARHAAHVKFMLEAIRLAERGIGKVSPNPMVGAVVVKGGKVVGRGWHGFFGGKHAEFNALEKAGKKAQGADLYVTLEPCNHHGKQPPCTKEILHAGIRRVFAACPDPNKASKNGAKALRKAGVETKFGLCRKEAEKQNEFYIKSVLSGRPFITIKTAMSSDGFITYGDGRAKRISGRKDFSYTQELRLRHDAILVGVNTVLKDNPKLTYRRDKSLSPTRIVLDPRARTPPNARVVSQGGETLIICTRDAPRARAGRLAMKGAEILVARSRAGRIDLRAMLASLHSLGIRSVLVEGGAFTASRFLEERLFDRLVIIIASMKIRKGLEAFKIGRRVRARIAETKKIGNDEVIVAEK